MRAWLAANRAGPAAAIQLAAALVCLMCATATIPAWGTDSLVPLWAVAPGVLVTFSATVTENQLSTFLPTRPHVFRLASGVWAVVVVGWTSLLLVPLADAVGQPLVVVVGAILTGWTFGLSVLIGKASALLGSAVVAVAMIFGGHIPDPDKWSWVTDHLGHRGAAASIVGALIGVVAYARFGAATRAAGQGPT